MALGAVRTNTSTDLNIIIQIGNILLSHADILEFNYTNRLNSGPEGDLLILDVGSNMIIPKSGEYGLITFTNTTDTGTEKIADFAIFIEESADMGPEDAASNNTIHRIKFVLGSADGMQQRTDAFSGTSVETIQELLNKRGTKDVLSYPSDVPQPSDNMMWRFIQENLGEQVQDVVDKSYLKDDYIFYVYDDVNDIFKISSLNLEMKQADRYVLFESSDAVGSTDTAKLIMNVPEFTLWKYDNYLRSNDLGKNRKKLFPNVSFSGIIDEKLKTGSIKKRCMSEMLRRSGDTKQKEILESTGMTDPNTVFGDLVVKRHWPNNVHKMYSFADVYRDYKLSTFAKIFQTSIYNNVGPPMGSKVTVLKAGNDYKLRGFTIDKEYSDAYILYEKMISYRSTSHGHSGEKPVSSNIITTLKLISDNFAGTGEQHLESIKKQLETNTSIGEG